MDKVVRSLCVRRQSSRAPQEYRQLGARFLLAPACFVVRCKQVEVTYANCLGEFVDGHHGRVALAALKAAQVLLAESGLCFDLLLRQAAFAPEACKIPAHKHPHVHAGLLAEYALEALSTIVCIVALGRGGVVSHKSPG